MINKENCSVKPWISYNDYDHYAIGVVSPIGKPEIRSCDNSISYQ